MYIDERQPELRTMYFVDIMAGLSFCPNRLHFTKKTKHFNKLNFEPHS